MAEPAGGDPMHPLPYHLEVAELLRREEPDLWAWMAGGRIASQSAEMRHELLRSTYRLDRDGHADLLDAADRAARAVGVTVPVALYQTAGESTPNAALVFVPDEAVVLLSGPIGELLDLAELTAVLGHELAHHTLWRRDGGEHLVTERLLHAMAADGGSDAVAESARRLALTTELYADRGGMLACRDLHTTVAALVKVATGTRSVVATSYLRQAAEVVAAEQSATSAGTHPETFIRAAALQGWATGRDVSSDIQRLVHGPVDLDRLDLVGQRHVAHLTRQAIAGMLGPTWMRTDAVMAHAKAFFPDPLAAVDATTEVPLAPSTRRYLAYVLLDLATADDDLDRAPLQHAVEVASAIGVSAELHDVVAKELRMSAAERAALAGGGGA